MPGIRRTRHGRGFRYRRDDGGAVSDMDRARIKSLAIPPAYSDVWICADPRGHLQATGRDARGRKQYRYHPEWRRQRDRGKFARMLELGKALPALRRRVRADLAQPGMLRDKVLAAVVQILARSLERIGSEIYRKENRTHGLTTLRNRHVSVVNDELTLRFRGKGGAIRTVGISDVRVARMIRRCRALPGQRLFEYLDQDNKVHRVDSSLVNAYLASAMGQGFTAKDIRTWGATQAAVLMLARMDPTQFATEAELAGVEREMVRGVAGLLGNSAAVCRASYVDPAVFRAWRSGRLNRLWDRSRPATHAQWERLVLEALRTERRALD